MRKLSLSTREAILAGAIRLLANQEFGDVTVRDIAEAANVAQTTLFRYFANKDEVLRGIVDDVVPRFYKELEDALELVDGPREKLCAICRKAAHFAARNRGLARLLQREIFYNRHAADNLVASLKRFLGRLEEVCQDGIRKGVFRPDLNLEVVTLLFYTVVHSVMILDRLRGAELPETNFCKAADEAYRLLLDAIESPDAVARRSTGSPHRST